MTLNNSTLNKLVLKKAEAHLELIKNPSALEKHFQITNPDLSGCLEENRKLDIFFTELAIKNLKGESADDQDNRSKR